MRYLEAGKDQEYRPCIELDDGTVISIDDIIYALFCERIEQELPEKRTLIQKVRGLFSKIWGIVKP